MSKCKARQPAQLTAPEGTRSQQLNRLDSVLCDCLICSGFSISESKLLKNELCLVYES